MIISGVFIQAGALLLLSAVNFWVIRGDKLIDLFFYDTIPFIRYPINIYPKMIQGFLTFILPYAFINFYPSVYLFGKDEKTIFFDELQYIAPVVSCIFFILGVLVWNKGKNRYQSTGT